jgi:hypothetical protein
MIMFSVFAETRVVTSIGVALVALLFLLLHLETRPYRKPWANALQTVAGTCLTLLSILNFPTGVFSSVNFDPASTQGKGSNTLQKLQDGLSMATIFLLCLPLVLCLFCKIFEMLPAARQSSRLQPRLR